MSTRLHITHTGAGQAPGSPIDTSKRCSRIACTQPACACPTASKSYQINRGKETSTGSSVPPGTQPWPEFHETWTTGPTLQWHDLCPLSRIQCPHSVVAPCPLTQRGKHAADIHCTLDCQPVLPQLIVYSASCSPQCRTAPQRAAPAFRTRAIFLYSQRSTILTLIPLLTTCTVGCMFDDVPLLCRLNFLSPLTPARQPSRLSPGECIPPTSKSPYSRQRSSKGHFFQATVASRSRSFALTGSSAWLATVALACHNRKC